MPYIVRKCDNHVYNRRNNWYDVHITHEKEDAISYVRDEMYLLYSSDPNLSSDDIDKYMNRYYGWCVRSGQSIHKRVTCGYNNISFAIINSSSEKYHSLVRTQMIRPTRTEKLDKILGS